jgi:hypothetical protein
MADFGIKPMIIGAGECMKFMVYDNQKREAGTGVTKLLGTETWH